MLKASYTDVSLVTWYCAGALCVTLLSACQPQTSNTTESAASKPAQIEMIAQDLSSVSIGALPLRYDFTGSIAAVEQTSIQSQVSATAQKVLVDVGQNVRKGQQLLQLNNSDNSARLAQARANFMAATAQANQAQRIMTRKQRLLAQGFIAQVEYEQSQLDYQNQRENARAQQASVDIALKAEQDGMILSPINGMVSKRQVNAGQVVSTGQTLFEIVNPAQLELRGQIPLNAQNNLKIGQPLQFKLQGVHTNYTAHITRVAPVADQNNRQIDFFAAPEQKLPSLSIGSYVQGQLIAHTATTGQIIALDRIQNPDQSPYVWLVRHNTLLRVNIRLLSQDASQNLALVQGLQQGDRISNVTFKVEDHNTSVRVTTP